MTNREATIVFNMIAGVGYVKYSALCKYFGSAAQALAQNAQQLVAVRGVGEQLALRIENWQKDIDLNAELTLAERAGVRIITLYDEAYPKILRQLYDPPLVLYVRGVLPEFGNGNALGVVGSRRMSQYGQMITESLTAGAVDSGFVIVSGLALGVDAVAHRTTVDRNGITVGVLGGGLMKLHPQENIPLAGRIVESGGAVISEFPMNFPVSRNTFPRRNRIVARLSDGLLVTEAGLGSGALITANLASDYSVNVMAVPGRVDNPQAQGCHSLIKNGANLVESIEDILALMRSDLITFMGEDNAKEASYDYSSKSDLPPMAQRILEILKGGDKSFDQLVVECVSDAGQVGAALIALEMGLLIKRDAYQLYSIR